MNQTTKVTEVQPPQVPEEPPATAPAASGKMPPLPEYTDPIDDALDDSFPASDPPPWTRGLPKSEESDPDAPSS